MFSYIILTCLNSPHATVGRPHGVFLQGNLRNKGTYVLGYTPALSPRLVPCQSSIFRGEKAAQAQTYAQNGSFIMTAATSIFLQRCFPSTDLYLGSVVATDECLPRQRV